MNKEKTKNIYYKKKLIFIMTKERNILYISEFKIEKNIGKKKSKFLKKN